jgi:UDP-N-acetylmuramoyl-tripeptide--D-alanyl-D-alanine ligase
MRAALEHQLERAGGRRRIAVLGEMRELGPGELDYHLQVGEYARSLGVAGLIAVGGAPARAYLGPGRAPVQRFAADAGGAVSALRELYEPGDCVLVKGSRALGLEAVADALLPAGVAQ